MFCVGSEGYARVAQPDEKRYRMIGRKISADIGGKSKFGGGFSTCEAVPYHVLVARYVLGGVTSNVDTRSD